MAKYVTPLAKSTTFSEAIRGALPFFAQAQQQKIQQDQFNQKLEAAERDRLAAAEKAQAANNYKLNKDAKAREDKRLKEMSGLIQTNWNDTQRAAFDLQVEYTTALLGTDDSLEWQNALNELSFLAAKITDTEEGLETREGEFAGLALGLENLDSETMEFVGTEDTLNEYNRVRGMGGVLLNQPQTGEGEEKVSALFMKDGVVHGTYLDPNGEILTDKDENPVTGPVKDAPYYDSEFNGGMYSKAAHSQNRADMAPEMYLREAMDEYIDSLNARPELSNEERRKMLGGAIMSNFKSPDVVAKNAINTAKKRWRKDTGNKTGELSADENQAALFAYRDEVVGLYNPKESVLSQRISFVDHAYKRYQKIFDQVNSLKHSDGSEYTILEKQAEFRKRSKLRWDTGQEDIDHQARASAENRWRENNDGVEYSETEAYGAWFDEQMELFMNDFTAPEGEQITASEQTKINLGQGVISKAISFNASPQYAAEQMGSSKSAGDFFPGGTDEWGGADASEFDFADFKGLLNISNYLPTRFTTGEVDQLQSLSTGEGVTQEADVIDVQGAPGKIRLMSTPDGLAFVLSDWKKTKGVKGNLQLPDVWINAIDTSFLRSLDTFLNAQYGMSSDDLIKAHRDRIKDAGL